MGRRSDVETADAVHTGRALVGLGVALGSALARTPFHQPWQGPSRPAVNVTREAVRSSMKAFMTYAAELPTPELRSIEVLLDDVCGLVLPPPWRRHDVGVEAGSVGGVPSQWIIPVDRPHRGTLVYFHGGGYLATTPRMYDGAVARLAVAAGCRVLLPDYRLAPEFPYPAALDDALAVYDALRTELDPSQIVVAGDSGGGGLAAALLAELGSESRPHPAAAILLSPEVDLALSGGSVAANAPRDVLPDTIPVEPYLDGVDPRTPLASPLYADLSGYPPLLVTAGGDEMLVDEIRVFVDRARDAGVETAYHEPPGMFHVFEILSPYSTETREVFEAAHALLVRHLA